jgi:uncharacterized surface protein with fasciclin (FAS1) repeats
MVPSRRDVLKGIGSTGMLLVGGAGAATARRGASADGTIVDVAVSADGFDVLVAAVERAGLADTLSGNRQLTVFAPTDEAFADFLAATPYDSLADVPVETLRDILTYHVTPGRRYADSVVNAPRVSTLNGADVAVDGTDLNGDQADIVATDIEASNGVIHVIDGVLLP